jgi:hypothetical protein
LLFGFAGGFRRSELVGMNVADVSFRGDGAVVQLPRSKTDQEAKGLYTAVWRQPGRRCPVAALETYLRWGRITEGPVFRIVRGEQATEERLYDRAVALVVKKAVASLGLDPQKYAGHSLRCGFVEAATARGATLEEIMNTTHHKRAEQVIGYMRRATPFERNASRNLLAEEGSEEMLPTPPAGYELELSTYGPQVYDAACGEIIGWGFRILRHLGEERFEALRVHGEAHCFTAGSWALITRWLTCAEAATQYGAVASVERGPRGGFRSITYGSKRFASRRLLPETIPSSVHVDVPGEKIACARGHEYEESALGKWCCKDECGAERGQKTPERRIWRRPA